MIARGASAVLVLPADLPAVSAAALDELIETAREASAGNVAVSEGLALVVPDRHGQGTNVLLVSPPAAVDPLFGANSRAAHRMAALAAHLEHLEVDGPLSLDVDTAADLLVAEASLGGPRDG